MRHQSTFSMLTIILGKWCVNLALFNAANDLLTRIKTGFREKTFRKNKLSQTILHSCVDGR